MDVHNIVVVYIDFIFRKIQNLIEVLYLKTITKILLSFHLSLSLSHDRSHRKHSPLSYSLTLSQSFSSLRPLHTNLGCGNLINLLRFLPNPHQIVVVFYEFFFFLLVSFIMVCFGLQWWFQVVSFFEIYNFECEYSLNYLIVLMGAMLK